MVGPITSNERGPTKRSFTGPKSLLRRLAAVDIVVAGGGEVRGDDRAGQRGGVAGSQVESAADALAVSTPTAGIAALGDVGDDDRVGERERGAGQGRTVQVIGTGVEDGPAEAIAAVAAGTIRSALAPRAAFRGVEREESAGDGQCRVGLVVDGAAGRGAARSAAARTAPLPPAPPCARLPSRLMLEPVTVAAVGAWVKLPSL